MLDTETRRRIDTARDILVGKVPDPKSQVEQITIALIYKFMNDMDIDSEEMGGKRKYFIGEYKKYAWANLISPALSGHEVVALYGEAIEKMTRNANLPILFRDIFKNAYLPYRDPETLKLFLKAINEFSYDHSERLGDAFEYLLSILGSQGDAGQFRTPRHIIEFMVKAINPQKDETILDPACGTAGFLISAYKHILETNQKDGKLGAGLKPNERKKLADNIRGYDISPDMVRLSLANMYLHGFTTPNIVEYDSLSSEQRWNETADVILANPPFMSPKGGIKPHKRFSVQSNRSEVLFVDYMAEHLNPNGRAAIIVPEGIIFQSAGAYKALRKYLVEKNYLWAVVSLPAGVFNPYAGVKTSILFLDKNLAKKTNQILFIKVNADGFDLGAQRRPIDKNDLPQTLKVLETFRASINQTFKASSSIKEANEKETLKVLDSDSASFLPTIDSATQTFDSPDTQTLRDFSTINEADGKESLRVLVINTSRLAENGDYNLSMDRYREVTRSGKQTYPMTKLGDICKIGRGFAFKSEDYVPEGILNFRVTNIGDDGYPDLTDSKYLPLSFQKDYKEYLLQEDDFMIVMVGATTGKVGVITKEILPALLNQNMWRFFPNEKINKKYLYHLIKDLPIMKQGGARDYLTQKDFVEIQIPLPPLDIQKQIVDEIAAHQRIIDGARQIVNAWKPDIEINDQWETVELSKIAEITSSKRIFQEEYAPTGIPFYRTKEIVELSEGNPISLELFISEKRYNEIKKDFDVPKKGEILISAVGTIGISWVISDNRKFYFKDGNLLWIKNLQDVIPEYLKVVLDATLQYNLHKMIFGAAYKALTIVNLKQLEIPLPPLEIQRQIVARIEKERAIVNNNKELIQIYEEKIKKIIEKVWQ